METLLLVIGLLVVGLAFFSRSFVPREVWTKVLAGLLQDGLRGIWHFIFGPPKFRIENKLKKAPRLKKKKRNQ